MTDLFRADSLDVHYSSCETKALSIYLIFFMLWHGRSCDFNISTVLMNAILTSKKIYQISDTNVLQ